MLVNMALSKSFNKLLVRLSDNMTKYADKEDCETQETQQQRPGSPFLLLLSEGDQEFNLTKSLGISVDDLSNAVVDDDRDTCMLFDSNLRLNGSGDVCEEAVGVNLYSSEYTCNETSHLNNEVKYHLGVCAEENDIRKESDEQRSNCNHPLTAEEFEQLFDHSGRLVNEHELRRAIFKGGVIESIRKEVWQFLFELYPFNTTAREREILKVEQTVRYEAMKIRWKKLLKSLVSDYEGVAYCPKWYTGCSKPKQLSEGNVYPLSKCITSDSPIDSAGIGNKVETGTGICNIEEDGENKECNLYNNKEQHCDSTCPLLSTNSFPSHTVIESIIKKDCAFNVNLNNTVTESVKIVQCDQIYNIKEMITEAMLDTDSNIIDSQDTFSMENVKSEEVDGKTICNHLSLLRVDNNVSHTLYKEMDTTYPRMPIKSNHEGSRYSKSDQFTSMDLSCASPSEEISHISRHFLSAGIVDNSYNIAGKEKNFYITKNENEFCNTLCDDGCVKCSHGDRVHTNLTLNDKLNIDIAENSLKGTHYNQVSISEVDRASLIRFNDNILLYNDTKNKSVDLCSNNLTYPSKNHSDISISTSFSSNNRFTTEIAGSSKDHAEKYSLEDNSISHVCKTLDMVNNDWDIGECVLTNQNTKEKRSIADLVKNEHDNDQFGTLCECCVITNSVSLSAECLQKLPFWIVQVINASTPPRRKSNKEYKHSKEKHTSKYSCDKFIRAMDEDINQHRELMGIIENANKYLKEKANIGATSPIAIYESATICNDKDHSIEEIKAGPYNSGNTNKNENMAHNLTTKTVTSSSSFITPISSCGVDLFTYERPHFQLVTNDNTGVIDSTCPYCNTNPEDSPKIILPSSLGEEQLKFMQIQAQVYAARQPYNNDLISESIRVIDKDVPRTDRELSMFQGNDNIGLVKLRDALLTYAFFNPDVGYAQGMNDIMARFLVVMDMESEAYWMFVRYMEHFKCHFMEEGMLQKISLVEQLLMKMDRDLYDYLQTTDLGLMFCHRWLLLNFKREFEYKEAIRLFEITSSRHLEVSSLEAELERSKQRAKEFVKNRAGSHLEEIYISPEIPFDIFICVAMLMECRHLLMDTSDISAIYEILSNLPTTLDLQNILEKAEELFYRYCRRTVVDCFQVIDELEVQDFKE